MKSNFSKVVRESALELEDDIKQFIKLNPASGKTVRLGAITKKASDKTKALNLKHFINSKGNERAVVAYKFHRQSAVGQPPAIKTGGLYGSIQSRNLSETRSRVSVGKEYGAVLDSKLKRYFFMVRVIRFKPIFKQKVIDVLKG